MEFILSCFFIILLIFLYLPYYIFLLIKKIYFIVDDELFNFFKYLIHENRIKEFFCYLYNNIVFKIFRFIFLFSIIMILKIKNNLWIYFLLNYLYGFKFMYVITYINLKEDFIK